MKKGTLPFLFSLFLLLMPAAHAAVITWDGGGGDAYWGTDANWAGDVEPGTGDIATFDNTCVTNCDPTINAAIDVSGIDIQSTYAGTITQNATINVRNTGNFSQAGGTFTGGTQSITFQGTFSLTGGTFTATSGTTTANSTWTVNGGTFDANGGTVTFSTNDLTITGSITLDNVTFTAGSTRIFTIAAGTTLIVNGTLTTSGSAGLTINTGEIDAKGDISISNSSSSSGGSATIVINGTGDQTLMGVGTLAQGYLPNVVINKPSGTLTLSSVISVKGNWTYTAGTIDPGSSTVLFDQSQSITGSHTLNHVTFGGSSAATISIGAGTTLTVNGTLSTRGSGTLAVNTGDIYAKGNITVLNTSVNTSGTATTIINGTGDQTYTGYATVGRGFLTNIEINKPSGTLTLVGNISVDRNWTYIAGTLDPGTSTIIYYDASLTISGSHALNNVSFSASNGRIFTVAAGTTLTVNGTLSIAGGANINIDTGDIFAKGDVSQTNSGTGSGGTGTITINGTGDQALTGKATGGTGMFPNMIIDKPSGILTMAQTIMIGPSWTYIAGTIDPGSSTLALKSSTITGSHALQNVNFIDGTCTITSGTTLTVDGTLYISSGSAITINTGDIFAKGDVTVTNTSSSGGGSATITFNGTGDQVFTGSGTTTQGYLPNIVINKPSGTLALASIISVRGDWTYVAGAIDPGSSTIFFRGDLTISGSHALSNVIFIATSSTHGDYTIAEGTTLTVNGTLTTSGNYPVLINTGDIYAKGDITISNTSTSSGGTGLITINGNGSQTFTGSGISYQGFLPNIDINKPSGTLTLASVINVNNHWTYTAGTVDPGSSTVIMNGTFTISGSHALNNVNFYAAGSNKTYTINAGTTLSVNGTMTISGSMAVIINTGDIAAKGDIAVTSAIASNGGTANVTINGTGAQTFNNSGGARNIQGTWTVNKPSGTLTLGSTLTLNNAGQDLAITAGTVDMSSYAMTVNDTLTINGTLTQGAGALSAGTYSVGATGVWNNLSNGNVVVGAGGVTNAGAITFDGGSSGCGNGANSLNITSSSGGAQRTWTNTGTVTVYDANVSDQGGSITAYHSTNTSNNAWTFTTNCPAGTDVYWTGLGADNNWNTGANWSTGSTPTNTQVAHFNGTSTKDATINVAADVLGLSIESGYTGIITQSATLTVGATGYAQAAGTFTGGSQSIAFNGAFSLTGGTFTATSGTITSIGDWTVSGGTFTHNSGTLTFGAASVTLTGAHSLYNLTLSPSGSNRTYTIASGTTITVTGTLTTTGSYAASINTGDIALKGDLTINNSSSLSGGSATFTINGTGSQTLTGNGATNGYLPKIIINKPSGTLTLAGVISAGSDWTYLAGTIDAGTSTLYFMGDLTITGTHTLNNLTFGAVSSHRTYTITAGTTITLNGTLATSGSYGVKINTGDIYAKGDITASNQSSAPDSGGTATITVNGTGDQIFTGSGTSRRGPLPNIILNKSSGTLTLASMITIGANWTHVAGTVDPGSSTVLFDGDLTITGSHGLYNVNFYGGASANRTYTITSGTTLTVNNTLTMSANYAAIINTGDIYAKGDVSVTNTNGSSGGTATVTINGTGTQTYTNSGGGRNIQSLWTVNKPSGTFTLGSALSLNNAGQDLTITAGTVDMSTYALTVNDTLTINGTLTQGAGALSAGTYSVGATGVWNNLSNGNVVVGAGGVTNAGTIVLDGGTAGCASGADSLNITSSSGGAQRTWTNSGTVTVYDAAVSDQGGTITAYHSTNTSNNGWTFDGNCPAPLPIVWDGGGVDDNWSTPANWVGNVAPGPDDEVAFDATSADNCILDVAVNVAGISIDANYTGTITQAAGQTVTVGASGWSQAAGTFTGGNSAVDINGPFNLAGGTFTASSGAMNVSGDFTLANGVTFTKGGTLTLDGDLTFTDSTAGGTSVGALTVGASPDTTTLATDMTADSLTVTLGDVLITDGYEITVSGTLTVAGTLTASSGTDGASTITVAGNVDLTGGTFTAGDSTLTLNGSGAQSVTTAGETYNNLTVTNASVGGVTFTDAWTAANFTDTTAGSVLKFQNGTTYTISGTLTLTGSSSSRISLNTDDGAASAFIFDVTGGAQNVSYLTVANSNASTNNITATYSANGGGNDDAAGEPHWILTPMPVYYSVGQNTTDHKTGNPTITIASGVATFSEAQTATNMGVGDKVTYNGGTVAYIKSKTSTTVWTLVTATGQIPPDVTGQTVDSIAHVFSSLSSAVTNATGASYLNTTNLVTGNYILNIPCYYDSGADTTAVTISGYTTGANNYIKIYAPNNTSTEVNQSQRHRGKWASGVYSLEVSSAAVGHGGAMINNSEDHVRIDGLQVSIDQVSDGASRNGIITTGSGEFIVSNNIIRSAGTTECGAGIGGLGGAGLTMKIYNNIIYDLNHTAYAYQSGLFINNASGAMYAYNNTLVDNERGLYQYAGTLVAKDNIIKGSGNTNAYIGTFAAGTDYNATDGTDAIGQGSNNKTSQTFVFADESGNDFHLTASDTAARNAGTDLSADANLPFSTDIDAQSRPYGAAWDIGADEATPVVWSGAGADNNWSTAGNWSTGVVPGASDLAIFDTTSTKDCTLDTTVNVAGISINAGYTGIITQAAAVTVGASGFTQGAGTFTGATQAITLNGAFAFSAGTFTSTSGTLTANGNWTISGGTFDANSGTITFGGTALQTVTTGGKTYNNLTITNAVAAGVTFADAWTTANFTDTTAGSVLKFKSGATYTISGAVTLTGASGNPVTITSDVNASAFTFSKASGTVTANYVSLKDSAASGGATWYAASNSTNVSGNTGWIFTKTISNAGGNWNAVGAWVEGAVPTSSDVVVATATSGDLTINAAAACAAIDLTNYTGTLTHNTGITLSVGNASSGSLKFVAGMTYTPADDTAAINFVSTTTGNTVTWAGKQPGYVTFNGVGGGWTLQDTMTSRATTTRVYLTNGTLNTNDQVLNIGAFYSDYTSTRTLNLGSSVITLSVSSNYAWRVNTNGMTLDAGTSRITATGSSHTFWTRTAAAYNDVELVGSGTNTLTVYDGAGTTFSNLTRTGSASKTGILLITYGATYYSPITVTGTFTVNGNSETDRILVQSSTIGTEAVIDAANVSISNADFRDINATGAANWDLSAITGLSGDCGGNTGITFTSAATQYWYTTTTGSKTWSDAANWYLGSGGTGGAGRVPLPQDDVVFDASSIGAASTTVTADMPRLGKNITWTSVTNTPAFAMTNTDNVVYGSMALDPNMTFSHNQDLYFEGRGAYALTTGGNSFTSTAGTVRVYMIGGSLTLQDDLTMSSGSGRYLYVVYGTFDANDHNVSTTGVYSSYSTVRGINMGSGTWSIIGASAATLWNISTATSMTFNAGTSTIALTDAGTSNKIFGGGGLTYNNISITAGGAGTWTFTGSNTFNDFTINAPKTVKFTAGTTQTITGAFLVKGTAGNIITMDTDTGASTFTLSKSNGIVGSDYLSLTRSTATGGAKWYAGTHSTNGGSNTGWLFKNRPSATLFGGM